MAETAALDAAMLDAFLAGYLHARQQEALATVAASAGAVTVHYGPGMGRSVEHFVIDAAAFDTGTLAAGDWLTLFGDAPLPALPADTLLTPQASEYFMAADLAPLCRVLAEASSFGGALLQDDPTPALAVFRLKADGEIVARVSCALASGDDVVLDRLATEPAWRGRGLARCLMRAAADWALAQGRTRMLLIASPEGHALYQRLGFDTLSPVRVFTVETAPR